MSGTVREQRFHVARDNVWVRFDDDDGDAWVGVFGAGELSEFCAVALFVVDGGRTALVIAGGQGYVVDTQSGALLRTTTWSQAQDMLALPTHDFVLVADATRVWAAGRDGDRPVRRHARIAGEAERAVASERLALDGIAFHDATGERVTGRVWEHEGWYAFHIDLDTLEFTRGAFLTGAWPFPEGEVAN